MVQDTKVIGKKTNNTEKALRHGQMVLVIMEITLKARNMEEESLHGLTVAHTLENFMKTILKDKVKFEFNMIY